MIDKPGAEDVFVGSCRLADGTLANIASHSLRMGTRPGWTVFGTDGWLDSRGGTSPAPATPLTCTTTTEPAGWRRRRHRPT